MIISLFVKLDNLIIGKTGFLFRSSDHVVLKGQTSGGFEVETVGGSDV